jgi:cobalt-precorrin-5B (C1)-methyltransferase
MKDLYHYHRGKKLRCGYTTGSCATAAAKAAAKMLIRQSVTDRIEIDTPAGVPLELKVFNPGFDQHQATCCVVKDAGDDHDTTDGIEIWATVSQRTDGLINIAGGAGIGRITKPGFWGKPGEPAINPVPRKMIAAELAKLSDSGWDVEISAPRGQEFAARTLNAKLGIVDGISIIGTTGIVEPMSNEALKQTIYLEIDDIRQTGSQEVLLYLGNYGQAVATELGLPYPSVKIANFIGDAMLYCKNKAFQKVVLIGHIGKISKLAIGAFNTHSSVCDLRIEAFVYYLALAGAPLQVINEVLNCSDSEEALQLITKHQYGKTVTTMRQGCIDRIRKYVKDPNFNVDVIIYSMTLGVIG